MARIYVVKRGDTLRKIAKAQLGDSALFMRIADLNGIRDPYRLALGQRLEIPARRELAPPASPPLLQVSPPHGLDSLLAQFGDIYPYLRDDGTLDPRWEADQLARAPMPFPIALSWDPAKQVRNLYCHKRLVPVFPAVFAEIQRRGLQKKVRTYGGCFNFRAKRSANKLSTHAWGVAIDLNPETNALGQDGDMAPGIVKVFESFGFAWGGRWAGRNKDPMHFQFCSGY